MFSDCTVPPDSKESELGSSDQKSSSSIVKNTGVVLLTYHALKCVPTATSGDVVVLKVATATSGDVVVLKVPTATSGDVVVLKVAQ